MERIKKFFQGFEHLVKNSVSFILSNLVVVIVETVIIGLAQVLLDYGSVRIYIVCFVLGLLHNTIVKLIMSIGGTSGKEEN